MFRIGISNLMPQAIKTAEEERASFSGIYQIIESQIKSGKLIIGGNWGIKLLLGDPRGIDDFQYDLYSENAEQDAFSIANHITQKETKLVSLKKELSDYVIYAESRPMLQIHRLAEHDRGIIQPINSQKASKLVLPSDYHLLGLYRQLYMPISDDWDLSLEHENQLFDMVKFEYNKNQRKFILGGDSADDTTTVSENENISFKDIRKGLQKDLLAHLSKRKDIVLVGEYACHILTEQKIHAHHLHIVATEAIAQELETWIKKHVNLKTLTKVNRVQLLNDRRLNRTTIYVMVDGDKVPVLYVYNSAEYDLIPFNVCSSKNSSHKNNLYERGRIGNPYVILRFLLVEIWIIKVIREMGGIDTKFAYGKILELYNLVFSIRSKLKVIPENIGSEETNLWGIFNTPELKGHRYIGTYLSDLYSKRQIMRQKFSKDYSPAGFYNKNKKYANDFNDIHALSKSNKQAKGGSEEYLFDE